MFLSFFDAINFLNNNNYEFTLEQRKIEFICVIILFAVFAVLFTVFLIKAVKKKKKTDKENISEKYDGEK